MKRIKIVVVGSYEHAMYAKAVYDEFVNQGYDVVAFDWDQYRSKGTKLYEFISRVQERLLIGRFVSHINNRLTNLVKELEPDLVFIYRGTHIKAITVRAIKEFGSIVFSYHNDDPFCGTPSLNYSRHYIKSASLCDFNFVYRHKNIDDFKNIGIHNVGLLRSYYVKENNFHIEGKKVYDLIFIGHFENDGRDIYVKALKDAGISINVFGDNWERSTLYKEISEIHNGAKVGKDYNEYLNKAKLALVFLSRINNDTYTRRCFEIPVVKTLMLSEYSEDLASMFEPDKEAVYFGSANELVDKCKSLLDDSARIDEIALAGYSRLMKDGHSISDRIDEIVERFNLISKKDS